MDILRVEAWGNHSSLKCFIGKMFCDKQESCFTNYGVGKRIAVIEQKLWKKNKAEVVTNCDHLNNLKYSPHLPFAFTEHGALMAASVLNTEQAVQVSVFVVRAFVKNREMLVSNKELAIKLKELEQRVGAHDQAIIELIGTVKKLMEPLPSKPKRKIGF